MIHLKSTLAVSALMLTGLVAASPFPYRDEEQPRKPRPASFVQATTVTDASAAPSVLTAWADPPAKGPAVAEPPVAPAAAETPAPVAEPAIVPAPVAAPTPMRHAALQTSAASKTDQVRRRKAARAVRERQIAARATAPTAPQAQVAAQETSNTTQRIDPIGDILRGLGIGRQS